MSDDGYYPGSPYDDLDDLYYDDDIGEHLADSLAEHVLPSPIYQENPAYEMLEYYSDWEYYSDDYYDDDPALLNGNPQAGSPLNKAKPDKSQARGKKRKLADTKDIPELVLDDRPALAATVQGTVWAGPRPQSPKPYEVGQGQRISLLKNWAQIFERSSPRSMLQRDESWANDLSLEDMGLRKVESAPIQDGGVSASGKDDLDEEDELVDGEEGDEMDENMLDQLHGEMDGAQACGENKMDDDEEKETKSNKRPRIVAPMPSPPSSHNSSNTSTQTIVEHMKNTSMAAVYGEEPAKPARGRPTKRTYLNLTEPSKTEVEETSVDSRKRKASPDAEPTETIVGKSTASSRAKRVASSKLTTARQEKPPPIPTAARATRSCKK